MKSKEYVSRSAFQKVKEENRNEAKKELQYRNFDRQSYLVEWANKHQVEIVSINYGGSVFGGWILFYNTLTPASDGR